MSKKKEMTVKMMTGIVDKWTREQASLYRDSICKQGYCISPDCKDRYAEVAFKTAVMGCNVLRTSCGLPELAHKDVCGNKKCLMAVHRNRTAEGAKADSASKVSTEHYCGDFSVQLSDNSLSLSVGSLSQNSVQGKEEMLDLPVTYKEKRGPMDIYS